MDNWGQLSTCDHPSIAPKVARLDFHMLNLLTKYLQVCYNLRTFLCSQKKPSFDKLFPAQVALLSCRKHLTGPLEPLLVHFDNLISEKVQVKLELNRQKLIKCFSR